MGLRLPSLRPQKQVEQKSGPSAHVFCEALVPGRASMIAQVVKNLPAMWESWVRSLSWEDPLEKGKATHSSILAWRIPWTV